MTITGNRFLLFGSLCWLLGIIVTPGCDLVGGNFSGHPDEIDRLSPAARQLVTRAYSDVDSNQITDYHVHLVGLDPHGSGTFVNEGWQSPVNLAGYLKFRVYLSASGIHGNENIDKQYISRLNRLIEHLPKQGRFGLMAFDYFHDNSGKRDKVLSTFRTPNDYLYRIISETPGRYFPVISIHPYREDAIESLVEFAETGARYIKWLPNSMGIHPSPSDPALKKAVSDYYEVMKRYGMVLITHTGDEKATEAEDYQHLGNPAYLRLPLSMGVKVVMAHVASLGKCREYEKAVCESGRDYFDIALGMLREPRYRKLLFADISAITQFNRMDRIDPLIEAADIHSQLVNGSDYPLPAVNLVIRTGTLQRSGHISSEERDALNEIYGINPLLFDYVLKRTVRHAQSGKRFPPGIFMRNPALP